MELETLQKTLYNHVGSRIRFYRKLKNMTQDQLAAAIHKSESTLSKYESGQIAIDVGSLYDIASARICLSLWIMPYPGKM